jgi:single-strand DNA-binding protein
MPQLFDTARIANDPVMRYTPEGTAVLNLSLPCDYGRKGQDGKKPSAKSVNIKQSLSA